MNKKTKLYLDIDGVLIKKDKTLPLYIEEFLWFVTRNFECFWLTTHCRGGENGSLAYLKKYFPEELICLIEDIKPLYWDSLKTEGIDFHGNFYWLDDYVFDAEKNELLKNNRFDRLLIVNLENKNELENTVQFLKHAIS